MRPGDSAPNHADHIILDDYSPLYAPTPQKNPFSLVIT